MRPRFTKLGAALAALVALAVGGSTLAAASGGGSKPAKAPAAKAPTGFKQQAPPAVDAESNDSSTAADTDSVQDQSGTDTAAEAGAESGAESGSETPGNDGPGGHADEPGNPNADTQQEGQN
jgi:hypothetical protein